MVSMGNSAVASNKYPDNNYFYGCNKFETSTNWPGVGEGVEECNVLLLRHRNLGLLATATQGPFYKGGTKYDKYQTKSIKRFKG